MRTTEPKWREATEKVFWIAASYLIWELEHQVIHAVVQRISG